MTRRVQRFTQAELTRVLKAAKNTGLPLACVRVEPSGAIVLVPHSPGAVTSTSMVNEWDQ